MPVLLQIDSCLGVGSTGRITESIGEIATANGWDCYIAYGARYVGKSNMNSVAVGSICCEYRHALKSLLFDMHGLGSSYETRRLIDKVKSIKPDVIHLHCIHGYYLNYKILFEYLNTTNIPVVWTFHDCWALTGHCAHFVEANCNKWMQGCFDCPLSKKYPTSITDFSKRNYLLKRDLFSTCKNLHIVSVSEWLNECVSYSFLKDKPMCVIPNGVDLDVFREQETSNLFDSYEGKFVILGVATQWNAGKGFEDYLKLSQYLNEDEVIVLVGLNKKQIPILPTNIVGLECVSSPKMLAQVYARADVLLSLSYAETFGMTIVEAAACGTPAVVYDNTAQKTLVTEQTGEIVQTGNVQDVFKAIQVIKQNGKEYYKKECRNRVELSFDKNKCFEKYIKLYNELFRKRK